VSHQAWRLFAVWRDVRNEAAPHLRTPCMVTHGGASAGKEDASDAAGLIAPYYRR
jgi:hypothetical protein